MAMNVVMLINTDEAINPEKLKDLRAELYSVFDGLSFRSETSEESDIGLRPFEPIADITYYSDDLPASGYWFNMNMVTRFYPENDPRGDFAYLVALAEWIEKKLPGVRIWYGHDVHESSLKEFVPSLRAKLLSIARGTKSEQE